MHSLTSQSALATKVEFLRRPEAYHARPDVVTTEETHMSWVFLAGDLVFKLKKPKTTRSYDWSRLENRRIDCEREVHLNRRLAEDVYLGVVPLTVNNCGQLELEGTGTPVDWLVQMRRLPRDQFLEHCIEEDRIDLTRLDRAIEHLCRFYQESPALDVASRQYTGHLKKDLSQSFRELVVPKYSQSAYLVRSVHEPLLQFIEKRDTMLSERVQEGRVQDCHGDLRPEHICLESEAIIIDCLQFDARLRMLDTASEISFLTVECERLGAERLAERIWSIYFDTCRDHLSEHLLSFYKGYHACLRAMVAVWHLEDHVEDADKWIQKAHRYLKIAACASSGLF